MTRRKDLQQMNGGWQMDLFAAEPEPATTAGPARPEAALLSPKGDSSTGPANALEPMNDEAVAWIAQHVIADYHLANESAWWCDPDQNWYPQCRCQLPCPLCRAGRHDRCRELRETQRTAKHGPYAPTPETHLRVPAPHSPQRTRPLYVQVWLADRACRDMCDCPQCGDQHRRPRPDEAGPTTVVCLKGRRDDPEIKGVIYVGRPMYRGGWHLAGHLLANPFVVGKHGNAETCVDKYRRWLDQHADLVARELPKLKGRRLGCWCPEGEPCHARVLAELADAAEVTP